MVMFQITLTRILQIYIGFGFIALFFIYLGYKTLKYSRNRLNIYFSLFYFLAASGAIINLIYAPIPISSIAQILHFFTIYVVINSIIFLTVFCLIFHFGEERFSTTKQIALILFYAMISFCMIFIPNGFMINEGTDWYPVWSLPLFIYAITIMSLIAVIPTIYFSIKIYKNFEDDILKKKWKLFIIGYIELVIMFFGTIFTHTLNDPVFRTIYAPISAILSISGAYLMFHAIAKRF